MAYSTFCLCLPVLKDLCTLAQDSHPLAHLLPRLQIQQAGKLSEIFASTLWLL